MVPVARQGRTGPIAHVRTSPPVEEPGAIGCARLYVAAPLRVTLVAFASTHTRDLTTMERIDRYAIAVIVGGSILTASVVTALTMWHEPAAPVQAAGPAPAAAKVVAAKPALHEQLVIATPDMLGTQEMPAYMPSALTLPADTDVTITVVNFDDATALPTGSEQFAVATGVVGKVSVQALDATNPNADAPATLVNSMDPATGVSHTFTISKLGINVPIAPMSKTTFTIHTGKAGTYEWQCMDPCGTGDTGWGGAMSQTGYMRGTMTVV